MLDNWVDPLSSTVAELGSKRSLESTVEEESQQSSTVS